MNREQIAQAAAEAGIEHLFALEHEWHGLERFVALVQRQAVYIVEGWTPYEHERQQYGIYSTEEKAKARQEEAKKDRRFENYSSEAVEVDSDD